MGWPRPTRTIAVEWIQKRVISGLRRFAVRTAHLFFKVSGELPRSILQQDFEELSCRAAAQGLPKKSPSGICFAFAKEAGLCVCFRVRW